MLVKGVAAENVNITRIVVLLRFRMGCCVCIQSVSGVHAYKWSATGYTTFAVSCVDVGGLYVL